MDRRRGGAALVLVLVSVSSSVVAVAASAASPPTRYAAPQGSGSACTKASPCDVVTAIDNAPAGSTVIIGSGAYGSTIAPLTSYLSNSSGGVTVRGASDRRAPVMYFGTSGGITLSGGSLSHLSEISQANYPALHLTNEKADHVSVVSAGYYACELQDSDLRDSLCVSTTGDNAIEVESEKPAQTIHLTGVTAVSVGTEHNLRVALAAYSYSGHPLVKVTNSILYGTDISATAQGDSEGGGQPTVDLVNSLYGSVDANTTVHPSDIQDNPNFANLAGGDYREAADSPTINHGTKTAVANTERDLSGLPRVLGSAPDIGAFERAQAPRVSGVKVVSRGKHSVSLKARVNAEGLPTVVQAVAARKDYAIVMSPRKAGSSTTAKTVRLTITHLSRSSAYLPRLVATNAAGSVSAAGKTFKSR